MTAGLFTAQDQDAVSFYQQVADAVGTPRFGGDIVTTGHSLGGALGGLVASIYGLHSDIFANVPFQSTAETVYEAASDVGTAGEASGDAQLRSLVYGDHDVVEPSYDNPETFAVQGEIAGNLRLLQTSPTVTLDAGANSLSEATLHSVALHTLLMYAYEGGLTDWKGDADNFLTALTSDDVAGSVTGLDGVRGSDDQVQALDSVIAYSVIDPALDDQDKPFGDTGAAAMFHDIGKIATAGAINNQDVLYAAADIDDAVVQYAGDLALHHVLQSTNSSAANGIVSTQDDGTLSVDLRASTWTFDGTQEAQAFKDQMISDAVSIYGVGHAVIDYASDWFADQHGLVQTGMDRIGSLSFGADNASSETSPSTVDADNLDVCISSPTATSVLNQTPYSILVGSCTDTTAVSGSAGNDMLVDGGANATFNGGDGNDLIVASGYQSNDVTGGKGDDTIVVLSGDTTVHFAPGDGNDTLYDLTQTDYSSSTVKLDLSAFNASQASYAFNVEHIDIPAPEGSSDPWDPVFATGELKISFGSDSITLANQHIMLAVDTGDDVTQAFLIQPNSFGGLQVSFADQSWFQNGSVMVTQGDNPLHDPLPSSYFE